VGIEVFFKKRVSSLPARQHDLASLKKLTSILVIDNDPNAFPEVETFRADGYNIAEWSRVESMTQLESGAFDIIVLDIGGVAKKWGPKDGLEILKLLKETNPDQYVIAFSGQKAVHQLEEFWKLSDNQLKKPVTAADCKRKLDEAMHHRADALHYWNQIHARLLACGVSDGSLAKFEDQLVRQVLKRDDSPNRFKAMLASWIQNEKVQTLVATLAIKFISAHML